MVEIFPETASVKGDYIGAEVPARWKLQHLIDRTGSIYLDLEAAYLWNLPCYRNGNFDAKRLLTERDIQLSVHRQLGGSSPPCRLPRRGNPGWSVVWLSPLGDTELQVNEIVSCFAA